MFLRRAFAEGRRHAPSCSPIHPRSPHHWQGLHASAALQKRAGSLLPSPDHNTLNASRNLSEKITRFRDVVYTGSQSPRPAFDSLQGYVSTLPKDPTLLDEPMRAMLEDSLARLSRFQHEDDHFLIRRALGMMATFLSVGLGEYAQAVFNRALSQQDGDSALHWLKLTANMEGVILDKLSLCQQLLDLAAIRRNDRLIASCLATMAELGNRPTQETATLIMTTLFHPPAPLAPQPSPSYEMMKHIINVFGIYQIPYEESSAQFILDNYRRLGEEEVGERLHSLYVSTLVRGIDEVSMGRVHHILNFLALTSQSKRDRLKLNRVLSRFRDIGFKPTEDTLLTVLGDASTPAELRRWRSILSYRGGPRVTTKVMKWMIRNDPTAHRSVPDFFKHEVDLGIGPTHQMVEAAVQALLSHGLEKPSKHAIERAMDIYNKYVAQLGCTEPSQDTLNSSGGVAVLKPPTTRTYQLLLRTLISIGDAPTCLPAALVLVEDIRRFEVHFDPQITASVIILLMRSSPSPAEALNMYRLIGRPSGNTGEPILNEEGYIAVLSAFCKLDSWPQGVPSTHQYFEIVTDMQNQGLALNGKAYTVILGQLALLGTRAANATGLEGAAARTNIAKTITRVHNHLTVSAGFTPDTPLWNQLMDAYQRAGCFADALRVWRTLFASGKFNGASVSIVLDACAFARAYDAAVHVYTGLVEVGYPMNVRNWNTFLECLCRLDKLDEAMKVLCLEMTGRSDGVEPDLESVRILLKFAAKQNREMEVRSRVKRFLPKLYHSLPDDLRLGH